MWFGTSSGGKRADLGIYVRSSWEANYARYLKFLQDQGLLTSWEYEPCEFHFPIKRGNTFYVPDFRVTWPDGTVEYHEVKGYMDKRSQTKLARMARYHPEIKIIIIDKLSYYDIYHKISGAIPGWEYNGGGFHKPRQKS